MTDRESEDLRADVAIGAAARARKLRFAKKPQTDVKGTAEVKFHPRIEEALGDRLKAESGDASRRKNLPDEVEPGVTYRDVEVGWVAAARIDRREPPADEKS